MVGFEKYKKFSSEYFNILMAEDNPSDIDIIKRKFSDDPHPQSLFVVNDGKYVINF